MVQFREFRVEDRAGVERMMHGFWRDMEGDTPSKRDFTRTFEMLGQQDGRVRLVVFEEAGELVGYAIVIPYWSNERQKDVLWIDELYVVPSWRNRGIGYAFFEYLGTSEAGDAYSLELEAYPWNQRALALYRNVGFTDKGQVHLEKTL